MRERGLRDEITRANVLFWVVKQDQRIGTSASAHKAAQDVIRMNSSLFKSCHLIYSKIDGFRGDRCTHMSDVCS